MSTVIHNAFAMSHCDLAELQAAVEETRAVIGPMAMKAHAALVARRTCFMVDKCIASGREWEPSPFGTVWGEVDDESRAIESTGIRNPMSDFGFDLSLIPDPATDSIYGVIHCEHAAWRRVWTRRPEMRDFSWDNRSDRPSSVRASEWARREEVWNRILPTGVFSEHGFSARITPSRLIRTLPDPMRYQPSLENRRETIAKDILMSRLMEEEGGSDDQQGLIQAVMKASARMRETASRERLSVILTEVRLPRRITMAIGMARTRPDHLDLA